MHDCGFWKERIDNAPLNKRGWVLQERLLTSRTVHFAHDQIMWENKQERACEVYPDGCNGILQEKDKTKSSLLENWNSNPNHKFDSEISPPYLSWYRILELYTRCLLTRSSDTLPAISGISKRIHLATHDDYLAGLWRRAFPAALLLGSPRPDGLHAPAALPSPNLVLGSHRREDTRNKPRPTARTTR